MHIEGVGGFYAGFMSPLAGQMFFRAASFSCFRMVIAQWPGNDIKPTSLELMRAGNKSHHSAYLGFDHALQFMSTDGFIYLFIHCSNLNQPSLFI